MHHIFHLLIDRFTRFTEKQGFPVIVTVCVAIITVCALWTHQSAAPYVSPTPPVNLDVSAAQLLQQSLRETATVTPAPTQAPTKFNAPLEEYQVLQAFCIDSMVQSGTTGLWQVHPAADLQANRGMSVHTMADGVVLSHGDDPLLGVWLQIDHDGITALYAGMAMPGPFLTGDRIDAGDTIGFIGDGPLAEQDLGPHLHLEVSQDGHFIDPTTLWEASFPQ